MGLNSCEPVDQRTLDMLVVADLDSGTLHLSKDDSLLQRCLSHPYMQRLERRVRCGAACCSVLTHHQVQCLCVHHTQPCTSAPAMLLPDVYIL